MPGMTPPIVSPRIVPIRLDERAFSNCRAATLSLFWKFDLERMKLPSVSASRPTGRGWRARMPGTHVGSRAMIAVLERIPMIRDVLPESVAMAAAVLRSFGALLRAS